MGIQEDKLAKSYLTKLDSGERLFRCNSGMARAMYSDAKIKLLPKGTPDYCGWKSLTITPDMVGKKVAVFLGVELKATKQDKMNPDQLIAKKNISKAGGFHREVREDGAVIETGNLTDKTPQLS